MTTQQQLLLLLLQVLVVALGLIVAQECFDAGDCLDNNNNVDDAIAVDTTSSSTIPDVLVLICTQSFTAEELVEDILLDALLEASSAREWQIDIKLVDEAGLDWTEESLQQQSSQRSSQSRLVDHARSLLVVASTYGDGDPPNHALQFADWLLSQQKHGGVKEEEEKEDPIPFAVFGLGDSTYAHYNQFGRFIDAALATRGGQRLLEFQMGDAQHDLSAAFQRWTQTLLLRVGEGGGDDHPPRTPPLLSLLSPPKEEEDEHLLHQKKNGEEGETQRAPRRRPLFSSTGMDWRRSAIQPGSVTAILTDRQELLEQQPQPSSSSSSSSSHRSVLHVALQIPTQVDIVKSLQPGDHVGVYPRNPDELVHDALEWLMMDQANDGSSIQTTIVEKQSQNSDDKHNQQWVERQISAFDFLSQHVDLAGRPTPSTLRALLPFVGTLELRALARDLTFVNTTTTTSSSTLSFFDQWINSVGRDDNDDDDGHYRDKNKNKRITIRHKLDLAKYFDCRPSLQALARAIGPLQPRLYSIATVDQQHPQQSDLDDTTTTTTTTNIGLCVSVTERGLCTNFMANLPRNSPVTVFLRQSKFHYNDVDHHHQHHRNHNKKKNAMGMAPPTAKTTLLSSLPPRKPVILVAAGSGIGPYLGFLQQALLEQQQQQQRVVGAAREDAYYQQLYNNIMISSPAQRRQQPPLSHIRLFLGARTPCEVLYKEKLQMLERIGGVTAHFAFSRSPTTHPPRHVQDLLLLRNDENENNNDQIMAESTASETATTSLLLWEDIFVHQGRVYVCGRLEICDGVRTALLQIAVTIGHMSPDQAKDYLASMEQQGRFLTDCWSVVEQNHPPPNSGDSQQNHHQLPHSIPRLERHRHQQQQQQQKASANNNNNRTTTTTTTTTNEVDLSTIPAWPSYLRLVASGEFERRIEQATDMFTACVACGRFCEVNRLSSQSDDWGECRIGQRAIVSAVDAHFGEEPCLKGVNGSGTIFFGACNLKCVYCQNWKLSAADQGEVVSDERLAEFMLRLQNDRGCHNINLVSPTHNILPLMRGIYLAARGGLRLPIVFNSGGYDSVASLRLLDGIVDIYMPDAKYASRKVARKLSKIDNYPEINQAAIKEMHRQVGDLQIDPRTGLAYRGLLVRHLVLPNGYGGTFDVADFLTNEVSRNTYTHVMKYYRPEHEAKDDTKYGLDRKPSHNELQEAHKRARFAGLQRILY